jgi:hypothetical protein
MATAVDVDRSAPSGAVLRAGSFAADEYVRAPTAAVSSTVAFIGDSITEENYGACPWVMALAMLGGSAPQIIHNAGHSGQSISGLISQIDLNWIDLTGGPMGLDGMPTVGWIFLRIGTNTARGSAGSTGVPIDGGSQAAYDSLITKLLLHCGHLVIFPVPPIGGVSLAQNTAVPGYNNYLRSKVLADATGRLHWIDDCADLVDGSGDVIDGYFNPGDELHPYPPGQYQMALTAQDQLTALFANQSYTSGVSTDAADVYPTTDQWVGNHLNAGTGGTKGTGITGTAPNGWDVSCSSGAACAMSIVAADGGDSNSTPWARFTPSAGVSGGSISVDISGAGATVTSSTPVDVEQIAEIRFNAVDATAIREVYLGLQVDWYELPKRARIQVDGWSAGTITRTWHLRKATHRKDDNVGGSGGVRNKFAILTNAFSGSVGSIDVRCYTNRSL